MVLVNSRLDLFTAAPSVSAGKRSLPTGALLLPQLRSNFAEFLNEGYLALLSIIYLPTCVGFGTGTQHPPLAAFLGGLASGTRRLISQLASHLRLCGPVFD